MGTYGSAFENPAHLGRYTKCFQYKTVVITFLVVEQHCVAYRICITSNFFLTTYFNSRLKPCPMIRSKPFSCVVVCFRYQQVIYHYPRPLSCKRRPQQTASAFLSPSYAQLRTVLLSYHRSYNYLKVSEL